MQIKIINKSKYWMNMIRVKKHTTPNDEEKIDLKQIHKQVNLLLLQQKNKTHRSKIL